jgi:hypothetical protein
MYQQTNARCYAVPATQLLYVCITLSPFRPRTQICASEGLKREKMAKGKDEENKENKGRRTLRMRRRTSKEKKRR